MSCLPAEQISRFDNCTRDLITPESCMAVMEVKNIRITH